MLHFVAHAKLLRAKVESTWGSIKTVQYLVSYYEKQYVYEKDVGTRGLRLIELDFLIPLPRGKHRKLGKLI